MSSDEIEKKIREAVEAGRVEFLPSDGVEAFGDLAYEIVRVAFGIDCAFISDGTDLIDFLTGDLVNGNKAEALEEAYVNIETHFGVNVRGKVNIVELCRAIQAQPNSIN